MIESFIPIGDTLSRTWNFLDEDGEPTNLSGCSAVYGLVSLCGINILETNSSTDLITVSNGKVVLSIPDSVTAKWNLLDRDVLRCFGSLQMRYSDGTVVTEYREIITITKKFQSISRITSDARSIVVGVQGPPGPPSQDFVSLGFLSANPVISIM